MNAIDPWPVWKLIERWEQRTTLMRQKANDRRVTVAAVADMAVALTVDRLSDELAELLTRLGTDK